MTMKTKKTLQHIAAVAVVLLTLCLIFTGGVTGAATSVSDEEGLIAAIKDGSVITLSNNIELTKTITIDSGEITINLNGFNITTQDVTGSENSKYIQSEIVFLINGGHLTVNGPGKIYSGSITGSNGGSTAYTIYVGTTGSLTIQNAEVIGAKAINSQYPGTAVSFSSSGSLTISDSIISGGDSERIATKDMGQCTLNGKSATGLSVSGSSDDTKVMISNSKIFGGNGVAIGYSDYPSGDYNKYCADGGVALKIMGNMKYSVEITKSTITGGSSDTRNGDVALSVTASPKITVTESTITGGSALGYVSSRGIGGNAISVGNPNAESVIIYLEDSTIVGGDAGYSWAGYGIEFTSPETFTDDMKLTLVDCDVMGGGVTNGCTGTAKSAFKFWKDVVAENTLVAGTTSFTSDKGVISISGPSNTEYYPVSLTVSGNGKVTDASDAEFTGMIVHSGSEDIVLNFVPETGFNIESVSINEEVVSLTENKYTISSVESSVYIEAEFVPCEYEVTFDANGGTSLLPSMKVTFDVKYGELPTAERDGFIFDGWYTALTDGTLVDENTAVSATADHTLYALWTEKEYTITSNVDKVGFDSVKVGYTQPEPQPVTIKNAGNVPVTLVKPTYENFDVIDFPTDTIAVDGEATFKIQPKAGLAVGNYGTTLEVTNTNNEKATFEVSFLVYQPSSGGSNKPVEEPEEPVVEPEVPTEEPEAGEATVETEVTDGGEVEFEAPVEEPEAGEGDTPAAEDEAKITGVVLPTGTEGKVEFVPISEQAAPEGKETQTKKVFEINVPTYEKGKPATIKFTMTVAELAADGKEAADVALWHFDEETGEWTKLVTSYTIVDGVVYFEAITNDFSPFAIVYEDEPVDEPQDKPETPESPAPVLGLITALGAAVALRRK